VAEKKRTSKAVNAGEALRLEARERERAEEALRQTEREYRNLFEDAHDAILIFRPEDEVVLEVNQRACELYGFSRSEFIGMSLVKITKDVAQGKKKIQLLLDQGFYQHYESVHYRKDGTEMALEINASRVTYQGRWAIQSIHRDITERQRAEMALVQSEARLAMVVEASLDAVLAVDERSHIVLFNAAAEELFGYSAQEVIDAPLSILLSESIADVHQVRLEKFMGRGVGQCGHIGRRVEKVFRRKNGTTFVAEVAMTGSRSNTKRLVVASIHDITERRRVEEAFRTSEAMSRAVLDHSPVGISIRDQAGALLQVNEAWKKIWAISDAEIQENEKWSAGRSWKERCPYLGDSGQDLDRLFTPEGGVSILYLPELEIPEPRPGAATWISMYLYALRNQEGLVEKVVTLTQDITERKRSEAAMRESEEKYRLVVEHASDAILVAQDGMMKFVNHRVEEVTGYSEKELTSRPFPEFIHPEDRQMVIERYQSRLQGKAVPPVYPFRIVTKGGEDRWVEINAVTIPWKGKPATLNFLTDITERRKAEEALRKNEAKYRELVENANSIILRRDPEGRITFFNEFAQRFFGFREEEILGRNVVGTIVPEKESSGRDLAQMIRDISRHPERYATNENENVLRGGERVWVAWTNKPILDPDGKLAEILCIGNDITKRKRAEERLAESEVKYRTLVQGMSEAVMQVDNDDRVLFVNPQFCQMIGYREDELLGRVGYEIYFDPEEQELIRRKNRLRLEKASDAYETRMRKKTGEEVLVRISGSPVADALGNVVGSIGVITDITERKLLEAEFLQAQKMEALGRLAGGVAHDFNNLLTSIMGYSDLLAKKLREDDPSGPLRRYADNILSSANRAASLTQQLLSLSRRHTVQMQVLNLNVVVADVERILRGLIGEGIELTTHTERALGRVKADPVQIEQVLMNLAVNARDAMPRGGRLSIRTANVVLDKSYARRRKEVAPGPYVMISVSDTGHGMDAEVQSHLFEPFFTTKEKGKGTGLGLSTAYSIVKQTGGHIVVESAPGKGSTFKIYLPRTEEPPAPPAPSQPRSVEAELPRGVETVLLAEDEEVVRSLAREILRSAGYTVLEAENGEEALKVAASHPGPIHLLLTDVIMPRIGGPALARRLQPLRPDMRVLFMSGYTDGDISSYGGLGSETSLLQKPFQPMALARRVREILESP